MSRSTIGVETYLYVSCKGPAQYSDYAVRSLEDDLRVNPRAYNTSDWLWRSKDMHSVENDICPEPDRAVERKALVYAVYCNQTQYTLSLDSAAFTKYSSFETISSRTSVET